MDYREENLRWAEEAKKAIEEELGREITIDESFCIFFTAGWIRAACERKDRKKMEKIKAIVDGDEDE